MQEQLASLQQRQEESKDLVTHIRCGSDGSDSVDKSFHPAGGSSQDTGTCIHPDAVLSGQKKERKEQQQDQSSQSSSVSYCSNFASSETQAAEPKYREQRQPKQPDCLQQQ